MIALFLRGSVSCVIVTMSTADDLQGIQQTCFFNYFHFPTDIIIKTQMLRIYSFITNSFFTIFAKEEKT